MTKLVSHTEETLITLVHEDARAYYGRPLDPTDQRCVFTKDEWTLHKTPGTSSRPFKRRRLAQVGAITLVLFLAITGLAAAATPASIALQTRVVVAKRLKFTHLGVKIASTRCTGNGPSKFFCIVTFTPGALTVYFNVTVTNGNINWQVAR